MGPSTRPSKLPRTNPRLKARCPAEVEADPCKKRIRLQRNGDRLKKNPVTNELRSPKKISVNNELRRLSKLCDFFVFSLLLSKASSFVLRACQLCKKSRDIKICQKH